MKLVLVITAVAAAALGFLSAGGMDLVAVATRQPASRIMLVYVGADDCAPCRNWQREAEAEIRSSPKFARLDYRAVKSPTLLDLLDDKNWPDDLRAYRDRLGSGAGVPTWLIVADDTLLIQAAGASQWREAVLPRLESLLR